MFVITHPFTSRSYSLFYNKSIIVYDTEAQTYHKFDPATQTYTKPKASECGGSYSTMSGKPTELSQFISKPYRNSAGYGAGFQTLEEATLAKLHLLSQLSSKISNDIAHLQAKYAEACPASLITSYTNLKLQYPEVFL